MKGLEGLRVLELGEMVSAAFASKLIADLGADVIKVEPPEGDRARRRGPFPGDAQDPEKSGLFLYLNTNKRGVVLDLTTDAGREELTALIAHTDVLIHNYARPQLEALGLCYEALCLSRPELVMCSITPFGLTGPYSEYRAEELTITNAGGWAYLSPGASEEHDQPPLKTFGHQADLQGGLAGASAALAAVMRVRETGVGEHIDLSTHSYITSFLESALISQTYVGQTATRFGRRGLNPWRIFECSDGLIFLATIEQDQWKRLVEFMGDPEWAKLDVFENFGGRLENADMVESFIQEWIAPWKVDDLYREGQKRRICFAPVLSIPEMAQQDQLAARDFLVPVDHPKAGTVTHLGPPFRLREEWWKIRRPAPLLGEHDEEVRAEVSARAAETESEVSPKRPAVPKRGLPLEGIRVADFSWVWAGPFCALHLAHLGAEVIKVESEGRPDLGRRLPIYVPGLPRSLNTSGYFNQWNQGKRSIRLDLGRSEAIEVARKLIAACDVVVDNFAPGVMDRLGFGYEALCEIRPDIIAASISGYGGSGPRRDYMAYGPAIGPLSGLSSLTGYSGGPPRELGISLGDPTAGITAAFAICASLLARQRNGRGQFIDVSLWESTTVLAGEGWMQYALTGSQPPRAGNRDPQMAPHGCFRCAGEDAWVSIACATEAEWRAFCGVVGTGLAGDERFASHADRKQNEDALEQVIGEWTAERDRWAVTRMLQEVGVPAFPSLSVADLATDPHLEARGFLTRLEHAEVGTRTHAGIPWLLDNAEDGVRVPAPLLGADTRDILVNLLGYTSEEYAQLEEAKVLS
jgi:crotonobetainyl-CoA:carnitine CoA-transferase CaiB-like acyl-CoA transferase